MGYSDTIRYLLSVFSFNSNRNVKRNVMEELLKLFGVYKMINKNRDIITYSTCRRIWALKIYRGYGFSIIHRDNYRGIRVSKQKFWGYWRLSFKNGDITMLGYNISWSF